MIQLFTSSSSQQMEDIKYQCFKFYRSHLLTTALLIVSLILDFRISQILEYSSLYFLASASNMFALSAHYRRFFSDSLSIIFIWIMQSLAFLFASATYARLLYSCWRSECSSCYLSLIDRPIMFYFYEIYVFSFDTRQFSWFSCWLMPTFYYLRRPTSSAFSPYISLVLRYMSWRARKSSLFFLFSISLPSSLILNFCSKDF